MSQHGETLNGIAAIIAAIALLVRAYASVVKARQPPKRKK